MVCKQCPRDCGVDRSGSSGFCGCGDRFRVCRIAPHYWEEPFLSGKNGSGAVFFGGCSLKCVFCQNYRISREAVGEELTEAELVSEIRCLENSGVANINLVNPTHYSGELCRLLGTYKPTIPVVWNSGGYEKAETLKALEGLVDIYLPDIKYCDSTAAEKYSSAPDYADYAFSAVAEMLRQTGKPVFDENGMLLRGTVIRHLVLPSNVGQTERVLRRIAAEFSTSVYISLMSQYVPCANAADFPEINRRLKRREYKRAVDCALSLGFENVYIQDMAAATADFIPDFDYKKPKFGC